MATKSVIPKDNNIIKIPIEEAMPDNYLPYAVEVAKDRALPDVRDGLKPVHRRIIYGSYMLKAFPDKPYYKSARIVGDILGKYHPHGDTSVYDAMVILAQNFTTRMPLIDGHGNWGSQDGDSAAAMRYTEARLTPISLEMMKDIEKNVVNMVDNYSGSEKEPEVLPARYPNLLVNGAFGIAVGLATNIPPHNLREVIGAVGAYIDNPDITTEQLMSYIKGPDLPTGGILIGKKSLLSAYETGTGRVSLRARTSIETLDNGKLAIVITEFPYRRSKAKLLQTISEMTADKRHSRVLEPISDIRDESDRRGIRAVIEFKKSADMKLVKKVLKYLFKKTDLQCNVSFNMVALAGGKPETMSLKTILKYYLDYQKEIVKKRTKTELDEANSRFHIVEGFIKAIGIMDEIIKTIRSSKSKKDAASNLMDEYGFTDLQAKAILELMLYRLTGLEIEAFEKEHKKLSKIIKRLTKILNSESEMLKLIKKELVEIAEKYGDDRRTSVVEEDEKARIDEEELVVEEEIVVTMSNESFIKRVPAKSFSRYNGKVEDIKYREGDFNKYLIDANTRDTFMFFTDKGNVYNIKGKDIPEFKWKEKGERLDSLIKNLDLTKENIISVYNISDFTSKQDFVFFTSTGGIKRTKIESFITNYTRLMALKLKKGEELIDVKTIERGSQIGYVRVKTQIGLDFGLKVPEINAGDRNIVTSRLFTLPEEDKISKIVLSAPGEYKKFYVNVNKTGILKISNAGRAYKNVLTNTKCSVLFFTDDGRVFSMPSFMLQNMDKSGMKISKLMGNVDVNSILKIISIENFNSGYIYFFTRHGMVKKTLLSEFEGIDLWNKAYKFKDGKDLLIDVEYCKIQNPQVLLMSDCGMAIKFTGNSVGAMGRLASGVIGINLKEGQEVIYSRLIDSEDKKKSTLKLISSGGNEKKIKLSNISLQNRAGRGKNVISTASDDKIVQVR
ncbi:DNA topoisomerase IV subunit A [Clostridium luticellarii]|uniref:DNA topoisomerase IV subunit A n=1 Tax=Clostridium luticellarii TaxID=1691940 RepID=UPI002353A106|nr:DNA topoisomerase IV subunit A [Clostridium luticellarii]MCI1943991.1 DNA topoisomerase IV subunit A [Clostridium luticellarii]MCI1967367.1 DNA topoisomerase IV subunit A [Clostridium luticellarii]MCI1996092.1 DNA topoisomerase IV subunit A [Clostridium luticellarii]MCI2039146.1 DNA topoisomerase IV subunit A [Clostridium luticellarii]